MESILETERTILRHFNSGAKRAVFAMSSNSEVQKYTGDVIIKSIEEAKATITTAWFLD